MVTSLLFSYCLVSASVLNLFGVHLICQVWCTQKPLRWLVLAWLVSSMMMMMMMRSQYKGKRLSGCVIKIWRFAGFTKYFFKNIMKRRRSRAFQRWITLYSQKCVKRNVWRKICGENIPRIGKLPYGAKRGFIERKALLKKGFIEIKALLK